MNWTIKLIQHEHRTWDGVLIEHREEEHHIPFACGEEVYYVHRKKWWKRNSPFVITKCSVTGAWATNTVGVILSGDTHIARDEFDRIFIDKEKAIEFCIKKNKYRKVKIYGE